MAGPVYEFGGFRLDCGRFELSRDGRGIPLERKPMELLILLVERQGELVTRAEIAQRLWSSEVFVDTEHGINTAVRKTRTAYVSPVDLALIHAQLGDREQTLLLLEQGVREQFPVAAVDPLRSRLRLPE